MGCREFSQVWNSDIDYFLFVYIWDGRGVGSHSSTHRGQGHVPSSIALHIHHHHYYCCLFVVFDITSLIESVAYTLGRLAGQQAPRICPFLSHSTGEANVCC